MSKHGWKVGLLSRLGCREGLPKQSWQAATQGRQVLVALSPYWPAGQVAAQTEVAVLRKSPAAQERQWVEFVQVLQLLGPPQAGQR